MLNRFFPKVKAQKHQATQTELTIQTPLVTSPLKEQRFGVRATSPLSQAVGQGTLHFVSPLVKSRELLIEACNLLQAPHPTPVQETRRYGQHTKP